MYSSLVLTLAMVVTISAQVIHVAKSVESARDWYVSTTGNDQSGSGTQSSPLQTIQQAHDRASSGDRILVADGYYAQQVNVTKSNLTFQSIKKNGAHISGPVSGRDEYGKDVFTLHEGANYITIDGFELSAGRNSSGVSANQNQIGRCLNHHTTVKNCLIHDCGASGIQLNHGDYRIIESNIIYDCGRYMTWCGSGISVWQPIASDGANGFHIIIRNNIVHSNENLPGTRETDGNGIILDNYSHSQDNSPNPPYTHESLVENNVVFNNGGRGIYVMDVDARVVIRNNTSYLNSRRLGAGELVVHNSSKIEWYNNIAWALPNRHAIVDNGSWGNNSQITWEHNLSFNGTEGSQSVVIAKTTTQLSAIQSGNNLLGLNPRFVTASTDPAKADFRLLDGSPAIDKGLNSNASDFDILGATRPNGTTVDIGAYEYISNQTSITRSSAAILPVHSTAARLTLRLDGRSIQDNQNHVSQWTARVRHLQYGTEFTTRILK